VVQIGIQISNKMQFYNKPYIGNNACFLIVPWSKCSRRHCMSLVNNKILLNCICKRAISWFLYLHI